MTMVLLITEDWSNQSYCYSWVSIGSSYIEYILSSIYLFMYPNQSIIIHKIVDNNISKISENIKIMNDSVRTKPLN